MERELLVLILSGGIGGGFIGSLLKDIVFDWLKGGKKNMSSSGNNSKMLHCADHEACVNESKSISNCLNSFKRAYASSEGTHSEREKNIITRLDNGEIRMSKMSLDIQGINVSLAKLVTIIDERIPNQKGK